MIDFKNINLEDLDFTKIDIKELIEAFKNFGKLILSAEDVVSKAKAGESLAGARLFGLDLSGADLKGANLEDAMIFKTRLKGANLENANFSRTFLNEADLSGANGAGRILVTSEW